MQSFIDQVVRQRQTAAVIMRAVGVLLCFLGSMPLTYFATLTAVRGTYGNWRWTLAEQVGLGLMFGLPGIFLLIRTRYLAKWMVPLPRKACPRCEHLLHRLAAPRCPECGCDVPAGFVDSAEPAAGPTQRR